MSKQLESKKQHYFQGIVISKKMKNTATVTVQRVLKDSHVHKIVRSVSKFHVHDPLEVTKIGDTISFFEGRHISKIKYMHFHSIIHRSNQEETVELEEIK